MCTPANPSRRQWSTLHRVSAVSFSPDGQSVLTASDDWTIWDSDTGQPRTKLSTGGSLGGVPRRFQPRWKPVSLLRGQTAQIWETDSGKLQATLPHAGIVWHATFSPDGRWVVTSSAVTSQSTSLGSHHGTSSGCSHETAQWRHAGAVQSQQPIRGYRRLGQNSPSLGGEHGHACYASAETRWGRSLCSLQSRWTPDRDRKHGLVGSRMGSGQSWRDLKIYPTFGPVQLDDHRKVQPRRQSYRDGKRWTVWLVFGIQTNLNRLRRH